MKNSSREIEFISLIKEMIPIPSDKVQLGIGDDAALLAFPSTQLVSCQDLLVEDTHFRRKWCTLHEIGQKAIAVNVSDLSACGSQPLYCQISIGLPPEFSKKDFKELYAGFISACHNYKLEIVGGDLTKAPCLIIDVSVFGTPIKNFVKRSTANVGDRVFISGNLGKAASILTQLEFSTALSLAERSALTAPTARLDLAAFISEFATSAIDISDGLGNELLILASASKVGFEIYKETLPSNIEWEKQLWGGEDYELLFTLPQDFNKLLLPQGCLEIGQVTNSRKVAILENKKIIDCLQDSQSYRH